MRAKRTAEPARSFMVMQLRIESPFLLLKLRLCKS